MAQQAQQQGGGGGGDNSLGPIWVLALFLLTGLLVWYLGHRYIVAFLFSFTVLQGKLVTLFINDNVLDSALYIMQTVDPAEVTWQQAITLMRPVGDYIRYPVIVILIILSIILYNSNLKLKFRKAHSMKTLRTQEQHNWKAIMPIVNQDLVKEDINKGPWAMALTPMEFARKHNLLRKDDVLLDNPMPGQEMTAGIRKGDAKRVFTLQLGPYWDGFERCTPHTTALAAVFMARLNRDRESATMILDTLDRTCSTGKPDFSIARPVLKKYQNTPLVQEILAKHAYLLTIMSSLIVGAREDGVVPSAEFLWLKPLDRRLWYMLNSIGRQTPFAEVAGPFAHWRAETELGRPSRMPMIDEAIKALEIAVKEVKLTPRQMQELEP